MDAGADHVVNHRAGDFASQVLEATGGELINRVVDLEFGSNLPVSIEVLKVGGTIAAYGSARKPEPVLPFYRMMYKDLTLRTIIVYAMPDGAKDHAVADINSGLSGGWLKHRIAQTMPLDDISRRQRDRGSRRGTWSGDSRYRLTLWGRTTTKC